MIPGWWEDSKDGKSVWVGDESLDLTMEYLLALSEIYQNQHGRGPSLNELLRLFELSLLTEGEKLLADFSDKEVISLLAKVGKSKKQAYQIGDYFAVPIGDNSFGYGRILWISPMMGPLAEFYNYSSVGILSLSKVRTSERIFYCYISDTGIKNREWTIIGHVPFDPDPNTLPEFVRRDTLKPSRSDIIIGEVIVRKATLDEFNSLEPMRIMGYGALENRLRKALTNLRHE